MKLREILEEAELPKAKWTVQAAIGAPERVSAIDMVGMTRSNLARQIAETIMHDDRYFSTEGYTHGTVLLRLECYVVTPMDLHRIAAVAYQKGVDSARGTRYNDSSIHGR